MLNLAGYFLYIISTQCYFLLVRLIAPINGRAKLLWQGQVGLLQKIKETESTISGKSIWIHSSSLGEFEQGRPVIEALKKRYPSHRIIATFFSPSGYEHMKNDTFCDAVYYLPFESKKNAKELVKALKPELAFWVKYDFWFFYLSELRKQNIPVFLLAAQFRPTQLFFKWYGVFKRNLLKQFTYIFCQNQHSQDLLNSIQINNHILTGDNRYDRVLQNIHPEFELPFIADFKGSSFLLIAGSSYKNEEEIIKQAKENVGDFKVIFAPHFIDEQRLISIEKLFGEGCIRYSTINSIEDLHNKNILILDSIGKLSRVYRYADAAFIGGGYWENGLHNCLEAAAFGMPICFGPKLRRFPEAHELVQQTIGTPINTSLEFISWFKHLLDDPSYTQKISLKCREFVASNKGATEKVLQKITELV
ncbi:MAG: 3-deoxy-D-manno-octulosonic acid transferase [Bacteroidetes bacterium B1(2017)]|nr:MAG: 3-deoxy-D-manno-octulosonic acid transferase [Bacteroidetes bacterium B1(2017)]